jgi:CBS domain-containing protein
MVNHGSSEGDRTGPDTPVWRLMTRAVAKISPDARLDELATKLAAVSAGAMGVGSTDELVGIVSERDLVRAYARRGDLAGLRVAEITTEDLICCGPDTPALDAARLMTERGVRHLIVRNDDDGADLQGIVSARDLIEALVRS